MNETDHALDKLLTSLQERAKELNCLYEVESVLNQPDLSVEQAFQAVVDAIPPGWQYPDVCRAKIVYGDRRFRSAAFDPTPWVLRSDITVQDQVVGTVSVYYTEERPREALGPFLKEEDRLIKTIAERLAHFILFQQLRQMRQEWEDASRNLSRERKDTWRELVELLRSSDRNLYLRLTRKLVNHLCWIGVEEAQSLLPAAGGSRDRTEAALLGEVNQPGRKPSLDESLLLTSAPYDLAQRYLGTDEVLPLIQQWIMKDKAGFFPKVLHNVRSSLSEIAEAIDRFHHVVADGADLPEATLAGLRVSLIRRFLTEHLEFISIAKRYLDPADFGVLLEQMIHTFDSHGKLGGKTAGLFLAERILRRTEGHEVGPFLVPKSWYIASDALVHFLMLNGFEEVLEQKYKSISQVRQEYPNLVLLFKNARFPSEIVKGLLVALDDFGDKPIIVRSSSLLEDRLGSAFSGKYKSLFLANRGTKKERLAALLDAISEVYASIFGPDPIEYRRERGLLDFHEEMAILIQEVVGKQVGSYYLPAVAGVAFSNNEFCWSPHIKREHGLLRLVPGLGTRAVDRVSDDYPILAVPGHAELKVNNTVEEQIRYSPRMADVIDLDNGTFATVSLQQLLTEVGTGYPAFHKVFSILKDGALSRPVTLLCDPQKDDLVVTFDGLLATTGFVGQIRSMLTVLEQAMGGPVDIELAFDGDELYLLQCRPQSYAPEHAPAPIPRDIPAQDLLFAANRHVTNGWVQDITHIVYVDPDAYARLGGYAALRAVGEAVSQLNKTLPKRQFILMGPGRWGSRGDIKLGVSVTYSDINNTAMLIEIARRTGPYRPDLSFGTHFFQDLVEASIRYLPLYPDEAGCTLNLRLLQRCPNLLASMLPEMAWLSDTVRVADLPAALGGRVLRVLMNAELSEAVGLLVTPDEGRSSTLASTGAAQARQPDVYWQWRWQMAEQIAAGIDPERFGVAAFYVFGSTKNATAGPRSDIDILIHFRGDQQQRQSLAIWLEGWSLCLAELNYQRTGYREPGLLDVHIVTDDDIANRTSFAVKIGAVTDAARELPLTRGQGSS